MRLISSANIIAIVLSTCLGLILDTAGHAAPGEANENSVTDSVTVYLEQDSNADGRVSEEEVLADRSEKFKQIDTNQDDVITLEEVRAVFRANLPEAAAKRLSAQGIDDLSILYFDSLDRNEDDQIELVEFQRPARDRFRQIDANTDGFATRGETTNFFVRLGL